MPASTRTAVKGSRGGIGQEDLPAKHLYLHVQAPFGFLVEQQPAHLHGRQQRSVLQDFQYRSGWLLEV
ncbi:hypothetical protein [Deinococcus peraridilitoris]|uniref:hypothetical protein n=1 Tax=Deinococcus peraridilitoris TaxID=432329 RepID=UPI00059C018B|nr:hypothetical protein [Deinococcus peraridilitoris]